MDAEIIIGIAFLVICALVFLPTIIKYQQQKKTAIAEGRLTLNDGSENFEAVIANNNIVELISDVQRSIWYLSKQQNDFFNMQMMGMVESHISTLVRKHQQLVTIDDYGIENEDRWYKELKYFFSTVVDEYVLEDAFETLERIDNLHIDLIRKIQVLKGHTSTAARLAYEQARVTFDDIQNDYYKVVMDFAFSQGMNQLDQLSILLTNLVKSSDEYIRLSENAAEECSSGGEYEMLCASILSRLGWSIVHRGGSGDQGVDIIGMHHGKRVAFQCKFYSSPVGNAAVQEVIAGKVFESADMAVVISNNTFTASAKQLAQVAGVILLSHEQLEEFTDSIAIGTIWGQSKWQRYKI